MYASNTHCKHVSWLQVEKAPVVIKQAVSKADAEALKKQLEAGALISHSTLTSRAHSLL